MGETRRGRPPTADPDAIALVAMRLFEERGFDEVTMDEIAEAAGVSRRTLFRLFPSKSDLVWGGLEEALARFRSALVGAATVGPPSLASSSGEKGSTESSASARPAMRDVLAAAFEHGLALSDDALEVTRRRLLLIASHPVLVAYGIPGTRGMRDMLAAFLATRSGERADSLRIQVQADALMAAGFSAVLWWAATDSRARPASVVREALRSVLSPGAQDASG